MFTAMNRIRVHLLDAVREQLVDNLPALQRASTALHQILDLELAIMLETYREDLVVKNRDAERLATIGQFAASIGHELRTPLGVIESSLFLLRQYLPPETASAPNVTKHLDRIGGEITRANKTIHDLDLARNRLPHLHPTALRELVESAAETALLPPRVRVEVTTTPDDLAIHVDPDQIRQVLVNLFTNSAQAMPRGGRIKVAAEAMPSAAAACIRVHDEGPGIPIEVRHRLFEALFTTKAKGSGLGLALCRRIVEAHGGSIQLAPSETGAAFVLVLPTASIAANMTA